MRNYLVKNVLFFNRCKAKKIFECMPNCEILFTNIYIIQHLKTALKRWVLSLDLKHSTVPLSLTARGTSLQILGAVEVKACSPIRRQINKFEFVIAQPIAWPALLIRKRKFVNIFCVVLLFIAIFFSILLGFAVTRKGKSDERIQSEGASAEVHINCDN